MKFLQALKCLIEERNCMHFIMQISECKNNGGKMLQLCVYPGYQIQLFSDLNIAYQ